jgi:hypothetical protein
MMLQFRSVLTGCNNNSVCEASEDCVSCPGDCPTASAARCGNGVCETAAGETCDTCPDDCNGGFGFCCSATAAGTSVTCIDPRCTAPPFRCSNEPVPAACCGDSYCEGRETPVSCPRDCPVVPTAAPTARPTTATPTAAPTTAGDLQALSDVNGNCVLAWPSACAAPSAAPSATPTIAPTSGKGRSRSQYANG